MAWHGRLSEATLVHEAASTSFRVSFDVLPLRRVDTTDAGLLPVGRSADKDLFSAYG